MIQVRGFLIAIGEARERVLPAKRITTTATRHTATGVTENTSGPTHDDRQSAELPQIAELGSTFWKWRAGFLVSIPV